MSAIDDILKAIGLATPFLYAGGAYQLFHWLDKKASDDAKAALASTLKIMDYDNKQVASALIEVFDRIYSSPLLHWRAFVRSSIFTVVVFVMYAYEAGVLKALISVIFHVDILMLVLVNISSDYISLFLIRRWLLFSGQRPIFALLGGTALGALVVFVGFIIRSFGALASDFGWAGLESPIQTITFVVSVKGVFGLLVIPAMIVFIWLPLFAIAIAVIRALRPTASAVGWAQWFLKGGKEHPLEAIGYVAAAVVFPVAAVWQYVLKSV